MITICDDTTKTPFQMIGKYAGVCWGADTDDAAKNYKRAIDCIESGHGRTIELPDVYMIIEEHSAKVIRELYTHIGGSPTRLQASTRYIDYQHGFEYIIPMSIMDNESALRTYDSMMMKISDTIKMLDDLGIPKEDSSMLLPLGMTTKMVYKVNLRTLTDMSHQRKCKRAFWEFRELFEEIEVALSNYSEEWEEYVSKYFVPKCEYLGHCPEKNGCGKK